VIRWAAVFVFVCVLSFVILSYIQFIPLLTFAY